jgi:cytochrome c oxidase subunit 3
MGAAMSLLFAFLFLSIQVEEYEELTFTIADSVYSSLFFLLTGFHGMHVLVGAIFITYATANLAAEEFTDTRHLAFAMALIY